MQRAFHACHYRSWQKLYCRHFERDDPPSALSAFRFIRNTKGPQSARLARANVRSFLGPFSTPACSLRNSLKRRMQDLCSRYFPSRERVRSIPPPLQRECGFLWSAWTPIRMPIPDTGAIGDSGDDTAGTNDALSRSNARVWRAHARVALSGLVCVDLTGMSFSVTTVIFLSVRSRFRDPMQLRRIRDVTSSEHK